MHPLVWLNHHRIQSVVRHGRSWSFAFDDGVCLTAECLWRLLEAGRIRVTSEDEGQQFGRPAPVIPAEVVRQRIVGVAVRDVALHEGTLDLELRFDSQHVLQVLPVSSGYEDWNVTRHGQQFIAVGGGELAIVGQPAGG